MLKNSKNLQLELLALRLLLIETPNEIFAGTASCRRNCQSRLSAEDLAPIPISPKYKYRALFSHVTSNSFWYGRITRGFLLFPCSLENSAQVEHLVLCSTTAYISGEHNTAKLPDTVNRFASGGIFKPHSHARAYRS